MDGGSPVEDRLLVRTYHGRSYASTVEAYWDDARDLDRVGYTPIGQHYAEGNWGGAMVALAIITIPFIVGALVLIYMATNRPTGTLTVTYLLR